MTRSILLLCVAIQFALWLMGPAAASRLVFEYGLVPARLTGNVFGLDSSGAGYLTFLTHIFLHGGLVHLAMNMVFLVWVGRQVEWLLGSLRMLLLFLAGGIAGGMAQMLADPSSLVPVIGASGAISAVFATYALLFARSGERPVRLLGLTISGETVRALRYAALWIGLQLLTAAAFNLPGSGGIAIWAHVGGFILGLLYGLPYLRRMQGPAGTDN